LSHCTVEGCECTLANLAKPVAYGCFSLEAVYRTLVCYIALFCG